MDKETKFRLAMCTGCVYVEDSYYVGVRKGQLRCGIPATKDCVLMDWRDISKRIKLYVKEV